MSSYDIYEDLNIFDQFGNPMISEPSRAQLGLPPQPPQSKNTGVKAGAEAALMFADDLVSPVAKKVQLAALNATGGIGAGGQAKGIVVKLGRLAGSKGLFTGEKVGTGIGDIGGVLGAADVLVGNDSAANKVMDTTAMTIGGILGAAGGPVGIAAGAGIGKAISDGTQFIFGDKKTAEQRRMEEALIALKRGGLV